MSERVYTNPPVDKTEDSDFGVSIFAGALLCLAGYGLYKLVKQESTPPPRPIERSDADFARLLAMLEDKR